MLKSDVIAYFGSIRATADAVNVSYQAVHHWPELIYKGRASEIEIKTRGNLKVDFRHYGETVSYRARDSARSAQGAA